MKKMLILVGAIAASFCVMAGPHGGPGGGGPRGGGPRVGGPGMGHHPAPGGGHHDGWGKGGRNFWPGFVGGIVGGAISHAMTPPPAPVVVSQPAVVVTTPTVVTTPVVTQVTQTQQVWVPGAYVDQVQANGTVIRVWSPGHYETLTVVVQ